MANRKSLSTELVLSGVLLLVIAAALWSRHSLVSRLADQALRADSIEAVLDTTRLVMVDETTQRKIWQQRAVQAEIKADERDQQLGQVTKAVSDLQIEIRALKATATSPVAEDDGVRSATFSVDDEAYSLFARVSLPPPPGEADGSFEVMVKPFSLGFRVACLDSDALATPAVVDVESPPWAQVVIERPRFDPGVCNAALLDSKSSTGARGAFIGGIAGALGYAAAADRPTAGDFLVGAAIGAPAGYLIEKAIHVLFD